MTYTVVVNNTSAEPVTLTALVDNKFGDLNKTTAAAHSWTSSTCAVPQTIAKGGTFTANVSGSVTVNVGGSHTNIVTRTASDNEGHSAAHPGSRRYWL